MALDVDDNLLVGISGGDTALMATRFIGSAHVEIVEERTSASATVSSVNDTASSTTLLAANAARRGAAIYNDSGQPLNLKFGATASASSFTKRLAPSEFWTMPMPIYTGVIDGIWDADGSGAARITEW